MCSERLYSRIDLKDVFILHMPRTYTTSVTTPLPSQHTHGSRDASLRSNPPDGTFFDPEPSESSRRRLAFDARKRRSPMLFCVGSAEAVVEHEKHARSRVDRLSHSSSRGKLELWRFRNASRSGVK